MSCDSTKNSAAECPIRVPTPDVFKRGRRLWEDSDTTTKRMEFESVSVSVQSRSWPLRGMNDSAEDELSVNIQGLALVSLW